MTQGPASLKSRFEKHRSLCSWASACAVHVDTCVRPSVICYRGAEGDVIWYTRVSNCYPPSYTVLLTHMERINTTDFGQRHKDVNTKVEYSFFLWAFPFDRRSCTLRRTFWRGFTHDSFLRIVIVIVCALVRGQGSFEYQQNIIIGLLFILETSLFSGVDSLPTIAIRVALPSAFLPFLER